jgi:predicted TIM-barrel fold metal-dependent hydrolase
MKINEIARTKRRPAGRLIVAGAVLSTLVAACVLFAGSPPQATQVDPTAAPVPAITPYIEGHTHFDGKDPEGSVQAALQALESQNAVRIFFLVAPSTYEYPTRYEAEVILPAAKKYPTKLAVLGGGGSLNAMIHQSVETGDVGPEVQKKFKERAEELINEGVAGFGEMTAEHFSSAEPYQYHYHPPDNPLFMLLADIAAEHGVPIDIHMEAVPQDMPLPSGLTSPPNAPQLHANIPAFERLLNHNPRAKIIWAHAGSDLSGYRTPELCRRLLQAHPNLFMEIKLDTYLLGKNPPLTGGASGTIRPDWLKLFKDFPDRFLIGSDQGYPERGKRPQKWETAVLLLNQLPPDLRKKIGTENALHIYSPGPGGAPLSAALK